MHARKLCSYVTQVLGFVTSFLSDTICYNAFALKYRLQRTDFVIVFNSIQDCLAYLTRARSCQPYAFFVWTIIGFHGACWTFYGRPAGSGCYWLEHVVSGVLKPRLSGACLSM